MALSMPMWPPVFTVAVTHAPVPWASASPSALLIAVRRRWMIVDDTVRREVTQAEYQAALESCSRVEVAHFPREDVLTHFCYRGRS
jgi:hypothetical protein